MTGIPEIALHDSQAKQLATSITTLGQHYNITMSEKKQALVGFLVVLGMIEGPRLRLIAGKVSAARKARPQAQRAAVQPAKPAPAPAGTAGDIRLSPDMNPPMVGEPAKIDLVNGGFGKATPVTGAVVPLPGGSRPVLDLTGERMMFRNG